MNQITVPFHGHNLFVVSYDNQPYTPMKPIVEGMGLDWKSQYEKLQSERFKACMVIITMQLPGDDQRRDVACIPLRKLPGWLMSLHPSRVKQEIREAIATYQNECDDVLWQYWTEGVATNPRAEYSVGKTDTLTKDEQDYLRGLVKAHVETLPKEQQGGAAIKMWSKLKSHFGVAYRDIPRHEFAEAVSLLTRATLPEPTAALSLPELFASKRWLVHMTAEGHLIWNEVQPDVVLISMPDMTQAIGKAWWGAVDTLADLNRICGKTGQKFDIPRRAA